MKSLLYAFVGILKGLVRLSKVDVGSRSVGVEDMIIGITFNSLGEVLDGSLPILVLESLIPFGLECNLLDHGHDCNPLVSVINF